MTASSPVTASPPASERLQALRTDVWRFLRWLGADSTLADDLAQEAMLRLLQRPPVDQAPAVIAAWLRTTALRLFSTARARRRQGVPFDDETALLAAWQRWAGDDGGDRRLDALDLCLQQIAPTSRSALDLVYRHRLPLREVAALLRLRLPGLKSLLARTRAHLHDCIRRRLEERP